MRAALELKMKLLEKIKSYFAAADALTVRFSEVANATAERYERADLGRDIERLVKYRVRRVRDGYDERAQLTLLRSDVMRLIPSAEIARARMLRGAA